MALLLQRTICGHLRRSRLGKIINVFKRIHLQFFRACGLASGRSPSPRHEGNVGQAPSLLN